ncbi:MAG TPA: hypothetical protein PLQ29_13305, partial [Spirochaetales bacterium]|nr:hypothetical protein [Spirochaetales bacterium]
MKKKYSLDRVLPGSRFTADAFSDGNNLFVPAGVKVRAKDLEGLKRWGITAVFSEGQLESPDEKPVGQDSSSGAGTGHDDGRAPASKGLAASFSDHALYASYTDMIDRLKALMDKIR